MKVAFFNYLPLEYGGGLARYYLNTASELHRRYPKLDITLITLDRHFADKISRLYSWYFQTKRHGMRYHESTSELKQSLSGITYTKVSSFQELRAVLSQQQSIYTKNDLLELVLLRFLIGYSHLPPVIIGYHTPLVYDRTPSLQAKLHNILYNSFFYRFLISKASAHHVLHQFDKEYLENKGMSSVIRLPNPFDAQAFIASTQAKKRIKRRSGLHLLWVGRLTEQKGVHDLIGIIQEVQKAGYENTIEWHIAGSGDMEEYVKSFAKHTPHVTYHGYVPQTQVARLYASADVFLSTAQWETLPYTFLEALSFGLPIISYAVYGVTEIIPSRQYGTLVSTREEFTDTILTMAKRKKPIRIGQTRYLIQKYSGDTIYPKFYRTFIKPYE